MYLYRDVLQDRAGNSHTGSVTVTKAGTTTAAKLYADYQGATALVSNTVTTNSDGEFWFYLGNGAYDLTITVNGITEVLEDLVIGDVNVIDLMKFGARGNGVAADYTAIQDAIEEAESRIGSNAYNEVGVQLVAPPGRYNLGTNKLLISKGGVSIVGPFGRGATFIGTGDFIEIGDPTNASRSYHNGLANLTLFNTDPSNTGAGVKLYRSVYAKLTDLNIVNFRVGVDTVRASTSRLNNLTVLNPNRTTTGLALLRTQGLDETGFDVPATYSPGGGFHITNFEGAGRSALADTTHGFLIRSCDGMYGNNIHITGCEETFAVRPEGNAANHVIVDINMTNVYGDEPSDAAASSKLFVLGGSVSQSITRDGDTATSLYRGIRIANGLLRGANVADYGIYIGVEDLDTWYDNTASALQDISFNDLTVRGCAIRGVHGLGAQSGAYVEPRNFRLSCIFEDNNSSGNTTGASDVQLSIGSGSIYNCDVGPAANQAEYVFQINVGDLGATDLPNASVSVVNNNLAKCGTPSIRHITVSRTDTGAKVVERGNILPGTGREFEQTFGVTTVGATTADIWSYTIPQGTGGTVTVHLQGTNASGSKHYSAIHRAQFRRNAGATSLKGAAFTVVDSWDPDTFPTPPTSTLATDTVKSTVTGIAAETIDWTARVSIDFSR
jgi:hypothetical protein